MIFLKKRTGVRFVKNRRINKNIIVLIFYFSINFKTKSFKISKATKNDKRLIIKDFRKKSKKLTAQKLKKLTQIIF